MQDYQERVVVEKTELDGKIEKLGAYLHKNINNPLIQQAEWGRLSTQHHLMVSYSAVLCARIAAFE